MDGKESIDKVIGKNIAKERIARNMSREDLADIMDLTVAHLGLIERGKRGVVAHTFYKLGRVFGVPLETFFEISSETNFEEHFVGDKQLEDNRKKIMSMLTSLSEAEIEFVVDILKALHKMKTKTAKNGNNDDDSDSQSQKE